MSIKWRRRWMALLRIPLHLGRFFVHALEATCSAYQMLLDNVDHDMAVAHTHHAAVESESPAPSPAHWRRGPEDDQAPFMVPPS